jgi:HTH-type transcriptional regulator, glycine betaine synthesis regulator
MHKKQNTEENAAEMNASAELVNLELEDMVREFFVDGVKVLGLPKSVGEIYGSLFISKVPLSLDDLVERLGISKGSGSQGLKMLRTLGAVSEVAGIEGRKVFYEADLELKSLVGGFIREKIRPHLSSAKEKIGLMDDCNVDDDEFYDERIQKLDTWRKRAGILLPVLQKILGS